MKTTIELPDSLIREIKLRAIHENRKQKEIFAELLRKGLDAPEPSAEPSSAVIGKDRETGLPVVVCRRTASASAKLTPQRLAEILMEQEAAWHNEARR